MKKIIKEQLSERVKDFGLTAQAINQLVDIATAGLSDTATDDDIKNAVDSLIPFAKAMQAEITRKTRKQSTEPQSNKEGEQGEGKNSDDVPNWFNERMQGFETTLNKLLKENEALKAEQALSQRKQAITDKAKALGIPTYLASRIAIADDADIEQELTSLKQDLVNDHLMPQDAANEGNGASSAEAMKSAAQAWAASLPNL